MNNLLPLTPLASSIPEVAFVLELGRALQEVGVSAPTLEKALDRVSQHLGLEGAVYVTPTGFLASLRKEGHFSKTYLIRVEGGQSSLEKLAEAEALVDLVLEDRLDVAMAREHLAELAARPPRFPAWARTGAYAICAMGMARIFGGGWREMVLASMVGLVVGTAVTLSGRRKALSRLAPLLAGIISALLGGLVVKAVPAVSHPILVLSGLIGLVPGLGLLVAMQELGTGNLVSGTARMAGTSLVFLLLAFGVGLGQRLGAPWLSPVLAEPVPLSPWTIAPALTLVTLGFLIIYRGRPRDYGWTLLATTLAWTTAHFATRLLGPEAGAGIAALVLGSACNQYARRYRRPGAVLLLPSLMVILPGSLGVKGLTMLMHQQTLEGLQAGFQAISVTVALMLGLLLANAMVSRRTF
jgi:uncharacterized membrane protein YjjP (DUF1212 family)